MKDQKIYSFNKRTKNRLINLYETIIKVRKSKDPRFKGIEKVLRSRIGSYRFKRLPENSNLIAQYSGGCIAGYNDKNSKRQKIKHVAEQLAELQASVLLNYFNMRLVSLYVKNRGMYFSTKKIVKIAATFNLLKTYKKFKARNRPNTYFKLLYPRKKFKYSKKLARMAFFDYMYYKNYKHVKQDKYL